MLGLSLFSLLCVSAAVVVVSAEYDRTDSGISPLSGFVPVASGQDQQSGSTDGSRESLLGASGFSEFSPAGIFRGNNGPQYEQHTIETRAGKVPVTRTTTNQVTKTHTLRVPSTSDVWVTSVKMVKVTVTQLTTGRSYQPEAADTVTSFIRITKTPIAVVTRTEEIYPTRTMVSVFTQFVTETKTVELWQPIVHGATRYEVLTLPVMETQTLLQRLYTTATVVTTINVTSTRPQQLPLAGSVPTRYGYPAY